MGWDKQQMALSVCPLTGAVGANVKPAVTVPDWLTVTVRLVVLELAALPAVSVTVSVPVVVKT